MSDHSDAMSARANRLLLWYPKDWRVRYGDEFAELLAADIAERPRSWRRNTDIIRSGFLTRLSSIGLGGQTLGPSDQTRAGLATFGCAMTAFLAFGIAIWSQLTIGWQWSKPATSATAAAMLVMTVTLVLFCVLALFAAVPLGWMVFRHIAKRESKGLIRPSMLFVGGALTLVVGARHFGNGWPGTGGHPWVHQGLVPGGVAAFTWASTLSVSSYWAHPSSLLAFPPAEIAWMAISPLAIGFVAVGAAKTIRRLDVSTTVLRYEAGLGKLATIAMIIFLAGAATWVVDGGAGPRNLFHTGAIDAAGLLIMAMTMTAGLRALQRAQKNGVALLVP